MGPLDPRQCPHCDAIVDAGWGKSFPDGSQAVECIHCRRELGRYRPPVDDRKAKIDR